MSPLLALVNAAGDLSDQGPKARHSEYPPPKAFLKEGQRGETRKEGAQRDTQCRSATPADGVLDMHQCSTAGEEGVRIMPSSGSRTEGGRGGAAGIPGEAGSAGDLPAATAE